MPGKAPVWFITAASSGFGHELSLEALKRGHTVIATARNPDRIQDLAKAGANVMALDVTLPLADIEQVAKDVFATYGRVDYLINAAGYIFEGAIEEATPKEVLDCFNTNVFGTTATIKAFLPAIRAQPVGPGGSRATIVTFGSSAGWKGGASYGVYAMTKTCMSLLAESLREELAPFSIKATVVEAGYFRTGFLKPGARVAAQNRVDAYNDESTPTGMMRKFLPGVDGNQPGDVKKGCEVIVDVLTLTGVASGREVPPRVVLGTDLEAAISKSVSDTTKLLEEWGSVAKSTDYDQ